MTLVWACLTPFLQAFLGTVLQVVIINESIVGLGASAIFYWSMFAMNSKRVALGKWKAIVSFIIFATFGTISGYLLTQSFFN